MFQYLWRRNDTGLDLAERRQWMRRIEVATHWPPSSSRNRARARNSRLFTVPGAT
jgi:hypothetical protein